MLTDAAVIEDREEWATARDVQQGFMTLGRVAPGAVDYSAMCRQAHTLGGDSFDFLRLPDGRLLLTVGDASGKGLAAALMIAHVQSSVRTAALYAANDGAAMLRVVSRHVYDTSLVDRYATFFYGVLDAAGRTMRYVNAGHVPPMVLRRDGSVDWLETGGAPLGIFPDWPYEEGVVRLHPGDRILAYTDGVTEAENPSGEMWGFESLLRVASAHRARSADETVHAVFQALDEFTRGHQADDATVLVLGSRDHREARSRERRFSAPCTPTDSTWIHRALS
ncbi:MAG TPA: PP2C family protein-serine/threonine phosphatase [Bryobacteraceae bacterium]